MIQDARTRLDDLLQLRAEIETEIVRERKAMKRAKELRLEMIRLGSRATWSQRMFAAACARYGVEVDAVLDGRKDRAHVNARHVAMWLMRDSGRTFTEIGRELGCDHTTALNGVRRIEGDVALLSDAHAIRYAMTGETSEGGA